MKKILVIALAASVALLALLFGVRQYAYSILYKPSRDMVAPVEPGVSAQRVRTSDGQSLIAWYAAPQAGQPVFLFFDGNGGSPEGSSGRWLQIMARGAGFLAVYYRGYSGSTGAPSEAGLINDARAGYQWLIDHGYRAEDIVIHGYSLGSAVAVQLAAEKPARALILEAPMTGIDDIARQYGPGLFPNIMRDTFKSREFIGRVHAPVLIVHGEEDRVIPFAMGEAMFAAANEPKSFIAMAGTDHATLVRDGVYTHVFDFLAAHPAE
ncbi:MAG: alpha/beta hydrolase [Terricaulis sp.]|nr:alpha/beta hydrolase [Terricaulis sp.]